MKDKAATQFTLPTYYHLPTTVTVIWKHSTAHVVQNDTARPAAKPKSVDDLKAAEASIHHLRDGDVVLYLGPAVTLLASLNSATKPIRQEKVFKETDANSICLRGKSRQTDTMIRGLCSLSEAKQGRTRRAHRHRSTDRIDVIRRRAATAAHDVNESFLGELMHQA